jgi:hypothetical protein
VSGAGKGHVVKKDQSGIPHVVPPDVQRSHWMVMLVTTAAQSYHGTIRIGQVCTLNDGHQLGTDANNSCVKSVPRQAMDFLSLSKTADAAVPSTTAIEQFGTLHEGVSATHEGVRERLRASIASRMT